LPQILGVKAVVIFLDELDQAQSLGELTKLVCAQLRCAGALVTQVTETQQEILANSGLDLPAQFGSSTPLSHSICQHTAAIDFPLVIDDTVYHPLLRGNLAFQDLGIAAYLGAPVYVHEGKAIGAICALEFRQRRWSSEDIEFIIRSAVVADRLIVRSV
jgi:GAF domain-containing protein